MQLLIRSEKKAGNPVASLIHEVRYGAHAYSLD
jgi:hypothetical protein